MPKIKTTNEYVAFLYDFRNAVDNVIGENRHWKRLAMSRTDVTPCDKCIFLTRDFNADNVYFCGNENCPCSYQTITDPHDFYCKMAIAKDEKD